MGGMRLTNKGKSALAIIFGFILPVILVVMVGLYANSRMGY